MEKKDLIKIKCQSTIDLRYLLIIIVTFNNFLKLEKLIII